MTKYNDGADAELDPLASRICEFLWFGFLPSEVEARECFQGLSSMVMDETIEVFDRSSFQSAKDLLVKIIDENVGNESEIVIPLSAGYDSRGLLGAALEIFHSDQIIAYTFGHKGSEDFDKAKKYTNRILKKHYLIDVNKGGGVWDTGELVKTVSKRPKKYVLGVGEFSGVQFPSIMKEFNELPKLIGYLGDSISGKKLPKLPSPRWFDAKQKFISRNQAYKGKIPITSANFNPMHSLPDESFNGSEMITLDDQLDWCFRQYQRIRFFTGAVAFGKDSNSTRKVAHPYADPRWWRSFIFLPTRERLNQHFYKRFLYTSFKNIFPDLQNSVINSSMRMSRNVLNPLKTRLGMERTKMHVNHDLMYSENISFRNFCVENIRDLHDRNVIYWLDLPEILRKADKNSTGLGRSLYALASLEINMKTGHI